jgi:Ca2+-binding RTX toxin-like protein
MTWYATTGGDDWIVRKGTDFQVYNGDGISDNASLHGNRFEVAGHITALDGEGLDLYGQDATVLVARSGSIQTAHGYGIAFEGSSWHAELENHGRIASQFGGVSVTGMSPAGQHPARSTIENFGQISGDSYGIDSRSDDLTVINHHGALIAGGKSGWGYGIGSVSNDVTVRNAGTIKGGNEGALHLMDGDDRVVNSGRIIGDVLLNNGNDTYVDKRGSVTGLINAGVGDDTYIIHHRGLTLHEDDFSDLDIVKASVNWTLGDNFERLVLTGKHNLHGTGSDDANTLVGNGRRNVLDGAGGEDMLKGGGGGDTFVFASGCGHDTIADFGHGADRIDLSGGDGAQRFGDLDIARHGDDSVITLSPTDTITLRHVAPEDLSAADFLF